jgi:hypothetical protein
MKPARTKRAAAQPEPIRVHTVTHISGRRVTCTCGWSTAGNISDDMGIAVAEGHLSTTTTNRAGR